MCVFHRQWQLCQTFPVGFSFPVATVKCLKEAGAVCAVLTIPHSEEEDAFQNAWRLTQAQKVVAETELCRPDEGFQLLPKQGREPSLGLSTQSLSPFCPFLIANILSWHL